MARAKAMTQWWRTSNSVQGLAVRCSCLDGVSPCHCQSNVDLPLADISQLLVQEMQQKEATGEKAPEAKAAATEERSAEEKEQEQEQFVKIAATMQALSSWWGSSHYGWEGIGNGVFIPYPGGQGSNSPDSSNSDNKTGGHSGWGGCSCTLLGCVCGLSTLDSNWSSISATR